MVSSPAALEAYREKRDFDVTPEPAPAEPARSDQPLIFVVQKHAARRLHYDFRLELDGVLKSWAVPRGPSLNPVDKRLAVMVEDHPLEYATFEGVIPRGQYGAGQVIIWDSGTYAPEEGGQPRFDDRDVAEQQARDGLRKGKLSFTLRGHRLRGSWTLVKSHRGENEWLLIKRQDEFADSSRDLTEDDTSVATGHTIADLKGAPAATSSTPELPDVSTIPGAVRGPIPSSPMPMLPSLAKKPFTNPDWLFEPKLDGVRVMAVVSDGAAQLMSRRGSRITGQYPVIAGDLPRRCPGPALLDGEIVALDADGRPSFHLLAHRMHLADAAEIRRAEAQIPVVYYVFDLLYLGEHDLRRVPLEARKDLLRQVLSPSAHIVVLDYFVEVGEIAYEAALNHGLEGIVAKLRRGTYEMGHRSHQWLKVKGTTTDDFVVGGYTQGAGERADTFGALLVGSYDDKGKLRYAANVGTGYDRRLLHDLLERLQPLRTDECPFAKRPETKMAATWVRPEMVVEVKFAERTPDGSLRAPVFRRVRDDKPPDQARILDAIDPPPAGGAEELDGGEASLHPDPPPLSGSEGASSDPPRAPSREPPPAGARTVDQGPGAPADADAGPILEQLEEPRDNLMLEVQGQRIGLTNLNKPLWPDAMGGPVTKRDFIRYLALASPHLLRHLRDRPLTVVRLPNGIGGQRFFQKHAEDRPGFVETVRYYSKHNGEDQDYLLCNNLPTLIWLGQIAALEFHASYSRTSPHPDAYGISELAVGSRAGFISSVLNYPDFLVFDIDPYIYSGQEAPGDEPALNRAAFAKTCEAALWIKETLDSLGLRSFVKTTGRTGLHIFVPILRQFSYDAVRATSETIALHVLRQHPRDLTTEWQVSKRTGKIFLDYNQGARMKTLAAIYSPRAVPEASVSVPLRWDELGSVYPTDFTVRTLPDRLARVGDIWADILAAKHDLKAMIG